MVRTRMEHYMRTSTLEILFGQFKIIRTQDFEDLRSDKIDRLQFDFVLR